MMFVWRKPRVQKLSCRTEKLPPREYIDFKRTNTMRKITAIAVALGFLTSVSLPAYATPAVSSIVKSDELSAATTKKKKPKAKKTDEMKKSDFGTTDLSAKKKAKKSSKKKSDLGTTDLSAKKKAKKSSKKKSDLGTTDPSAMKKTKRSSRKTSDRHNAVQAESNNPSRGR